MNLSLTSQIGLPDFVLQSLLAADPEAAAYRPAAIL